MYGGQALINWRWPFWQSPNINAALYQCSVLCELTLPGSPGSGPAFPYKLRYIHRRLRIGGDGGDNGDGRYLHEFEAYYIS